MNWLIYPEILEFSQVDCKIKCREDLTIEGYLCQQGFFNVKLLEKLKVDKICYGFEQCKFETKLCTKDEYVIFKMYKLLLKLETEEKTNERMHDKMH